MSEMCSVCIVRAQRDDDDFLPCSPACFRAALSACEQRVRSAELAEAKALLASRDEAWFSGVEAARDAVAAIPHWDEDSGETLFRACDKDDALAAIDALRFSSGTLTATEGIGKS